MNHFAKRRKQTCRLVRLLNIFAAHTPGVQAVSREILDLDGSGSLTPVDALLRIEEDAGGQSRIEEGSIVGAPELVVLVSPDSYPGGGLNRR